MKTKLVLSVIFLWFVYLGIWLPIDGFFVAVEPATQAQTAADQRVIETCGWQEIEGTRHFTYVCEQRIVSDESPITGVATGSYSEMESGQVTFPFGIETIILGFSGERGLWGSFLAFWQALTGIMTVIMGVSFLPFIGSND